MLPSSPKKKLVYSYDFDALAKKKMKIKCRYMSAEALLQQ